MQKNIGIFVLSLLSLLTCAWADIVYLCDCHATQNGIHPFAGIIFYSKAPNGNQAPRAQDIAIVEQGPNAFNDEQFPHAGIFPVTGEVFVANALNPQATFTQVAGSGSNSGGSWTCRRDNSSPLFDDGFISCNREFYCQPNF